MITELIEEYFKDSKIKDVHRVDYVVLCDYYHEAKTFKSKHFKKLKNKFKKERQYETTH